MGPGVSLNQVISSIALGHEVTVVLIVMKAANAVDKNKKESMHLLFKKAKR